CGPHSSSAYGTAFECAAPRTAATKTALIQGAPTPCELGDTHRDLEHPAVEPDVSTAARDADVGCPVRPRARVCGLQLDLQPGGGLPGPHLPAEMPEAGVRLRVPRGQPADRGVRDRRRR